MRIAAYCRVSTDTDDQLNSIEMQKKFFIEYAERNKHELIHIYADEGISGTKIKNRVEFKRLMKDAESGLFDLVVVKDISRFARNTVDFLQSIRTLKSLNIDTIFLTANMTSLGNSEFVLTIFSALAQEESSNMSKRIKFSKQINAEKGRVPTQVYGYDKTKGDYFNLDINEEECGWVKQIFNWYTEEGYGALKIANTLNSFDVKTKRGNKWSQVAICRLLRNELYAGKIINGKQEISNFLTGERIDKDEEDWFVFERPDLAIITQEQYDKAIKILSERHSAFNITKERHSNKYPLSTLIKCKECGFSFRRFERTYVNTYIRWICSGRNRYGTGSCGNTTTVDEAELLAVIDNYLRMIAKNKDTIIKTTENKSNKISKYDSDGDIGRIKISINEKEKRRQKYLDMYADELISREELNTQVLKIKSEISILNAELSKLNGNDSSADLRSVVKTLDLIENICNVETKTNSQLKSIIDKIEVDRYGKTEIHIKSIDSMSLSHL